MEFKTKNEKKFNFALMIACLLGGAIGWFLAEIIKSKFLFSLPSVLEVGIYFMIIIAGIALVALISELILNRIKSSWKGPEIVIAFLILLASILIFGALGCLFQFLYGLGFSNKKIGNIDDYLFVIDNSSSTDDSDPDNKRFSEVQTLIESLDSSKRVAVEIFDDEIEGAFPLSELTDTSKQELANFFVQAQIIPKGGTDIQLVLTDVIDKYLDEGRNAAVILLSDGESMEPVDYNMLSDLYIDKKVPIYGVAFDNIGRTGEELMTELAEKTNGYFCQIDDLSDFKNTLETMIKLTSDRNLLERRRGTDVDNILACILRILFISILGILVEVALSLILDSEELIKKSFLIHLPFSIAAGLVLEIVIRYLPTQYTRLIMVLLMAIVLSSFMKITSILVGSDGFDFDNNNITNTQTSYPSEFDKTFF